MSLDYTYTVGYGFFINRHDLPDQDKGYGLYEDALDFLDTVPNGELLTAASASSSMDDDPEAVLIAIADSLIYGDAKAPDHTCQSPTLVQTFDESTAPQELAALDAAAAKLGIEFITPQTYFYITVS